MIADLTTPVDAPKPSRAQTLAEYIEKQIVENSLSKGDRIGTKEDIRVRFRVAAATVNLRPSCLDRRRPDLLPWSRRAASRPPQTPQSMTGSKDRTAMGAHGHG